MDDITCGEVEEDVSKKVALHTLGCKLNVAETAAIGRQFTDRGFSIVPFTEPADVCVINTCSVTEKADRECRQIVRRFRRLSPQAFVVVIGCYAQLQPNEISSIEGVNLILGAKEKFNIFDHAGNFSKDLPLVVNVTPIRAIDTLFEANSAGLAERTRAFLKVQDGCDYNCTFCTIPLARGASRSVPEATVIAQAKELIAQGYKEIVLTGVNTGDYARREGGTLLSLLKHVVKIRGLERLRISSIEPNLLSDELLDFWFHEPILCKHWHIPLQSGSDPILKMMKRRYSSSWFRHRLERIHSKISDAGIGCDVIVGFPGETDAYFEETHKFISDTPIRYLHVFNYSERRDTPAIVLPGKVSDKSRKERSERLRLLSLKKKLEQARSFVGRTVPVLFEEREPDGSYSGLTEHYLRVFAGNWPNAVENRISNVKILEALPDGSAKGSIILNNSLSFEASSPMKMWNE